MQFKLIQCFYIDCAKSTFIKSTDRIVGGALAAIGSIPYQASLHRSSSSASPFCGGTILNRYFILSAQHCFGKSSLTQTYIVFSDNILAFLVLVNDQGQIDINVANMRVKVGYNNWGDPESTVQIRLVASLHLHSDYDPVSFRNDIAVLRLSVPLDYTAEVQPACLPDRNYRVKLTVYEENLFGLITTHLLFSLKMTVHFQP